MHRHGRLTRPTRVVVIAMLLSVGCAHRTQHVERAMVLPSMAAVYEVESNQRFVMAAPIESPDPDYPNDVQLDGVLQLCTTFVVTTGGEIEGIAFDRDSPACGESGSAAVAPFEDAVRAALVRWRYFGAAVCTFPDGVDPDADPRCDGDGVRVDAVPIHLRYVFTFSSGRVVRARASPSAH